MIMPFSRVVALINVISSEIDIIHVNLFNFKKEIRILFCTAISLMRLYYIHGTFCETDDFLYLSIYVHNKYRCPWKFIF